MYTLLKSASYRRCFLYMRTSSLVASFRKVIFVGGGRSFAWCFGNRNTRCMCDGFNRFCWTGFCCYFGNVGVGRSHVSESGIEPTMVVVKCLLHGPYSSCEVVVLCGAVGLLVNTDIETEMTVS